VKKLEKRGENGASQKDLALTLRVNPQGYYFYSP